MAMRPRDGYAPGWGADAIEMMSGRSADRAAFATSYLRPGMRVLDAGCGPGTITLALAERVAPGGKVVGVDINSEQLELACARATRTSVAGISFEQGSVYELPFSDSSFDLIFAHGLFEHLSEPGRALAEVGRVLQPGGLLALCSSDWSRAHVEPCDDDVAAALRGHFLLRRRAGGEPYCGGLLRTWLVRGGWVLVETREADYVDLTYQQLACYVGARLLSAQAASGDEDKVLSEALAGAKRWQRREGGVFTQRWVACIAQRA